MSQRLVHCSIPAHHLKQNHLQCMTSGKDVNSALRMGGHYNKEEEGLKEKWKE